MPALQALTENLGPDSFYQPEPSFRTMLLASSVTELGKEEKKNKGRGVRMRSGFGDEEKVGEKAR